MKIIKNTLEPVIDRWDDPGDYPNGLAGGPLPSKDYVVEIAGQLIVQLNKEEMRKAIKLYLEENIEDIDYGLGGISVIEWSIEAITFDKILLRVEEFEER